MTYEEQVENLDIFQKTKVYLDYKITLLALKHNFMWWLPPPRDAYTRKKSDAIDMTHHNPAYLWKDIVSVDFDTFVSKDNILIRDMGEDWESRGFAQKIRKDYTGIYDWYWKFNDRINA